MAFTVEDGTGLTDSNSYVSVQEYRDYFADRGIDVLSETDVVIQGYLVQATDFLDLQYEYVGWKLLDTQALQFPREAYDLETGLVVSLLVPKAIKNATIEITKQLKAGTDIYSDANLLLSSKTEKVGPIEKSQSYKDMITSAVDRFKQVNLLLKPYLATPAGTQQQVPVITG